MSARGVRDLWVQVIAASACPHCLAKYAGASQRGEGGVGSRTGGGGHAPQSEAREEERRGGQRH
eukprot:1737625-Pyramimonas_sp.AAC.1